MSSVTGASRDSAPGNAEREAWATSGAMALTGARDGPPLSPGWSVASFMAGMANDLVALGVPRVDGAALLGERAARSRLTRRGVIAPGGSCRLVRAADGWIAVNLARPDDVALANAWLDDARLDADDPWPRLTRAVASSPAIPARRPLPSEIPQR